MEINLPNNTAREKSKPPKLSENLYTKMKCEMKRSSKMALMWAVSRKHSEKGETIVPAWAGFQVLSQSNQSKEVSIGFLPGISAPPTQKKCNRDYYQQSYEMQKWTSAKKHFSGGGSGNI